MPIAYEPVNQAILLDCVKILKLSSWHHDQIDYPDNELPLKLRNALDKQNDDYLRVWYHRNTDDEVDVTVFFQRMKDESAYHDVEMWAVSFGFDESLISDLASDPDYVNFLKGLESLQGKMGLGTNAGTIAEFVRDVLRLDGVHSVDVRSSSNPDGRKIGRLERVARNYYRPVHNRLWKVSRHTDNYRHRHWGKGKRCEIWTYELNIV